MFVTALKPADLDHIGGKARGLYRLQVAGVHVPDFRVLSAEVFDSVVGGARGAEAVARILALTTFEMLREACASIGGPVAIRSSGLMEDAEDHSFAGIHDTELNVVGADDCARAIQRIWASAFSERASTYRLSRGIGDNTRMAVVVQDMVAPLFSGVAFGLNPTTGDRNSVWVSMTSGLGEALVSGAVQGEEFVDEMGCLRAVDSARAVSDVPFVAEVVRLTRELGRTFGAPQDIEWAWDGSRVWCLQARPVTAKIARTQTRTTVFDNSNIQESYCGITTPLTFSYASTAYARVYDQTLKFMGVPAAKLELATRRHQNMLALIEGRVYYNINNWYATLLDLPSFGRRKAEMEDMMGLESPVEFVTDTDVPLSAKLRTLPTFAFLVGKLLWKFSTMKAAVASFDRWFWSVYKSVDLAALDKYDDASLVTEIARLQDAFLAKWGIPIINDLKCMMMMGSVKRALAKVGLEAELKNFMYGAEIESIKPTLEIHRLSRLIASSSVALDILQASAGHECLSRLRLLTPEIAAEVSAFIQLYGDRCMGELKLETITMRQDSEIFFGLVRSYIQAGAHKQDSLFTFQDESGDRLAKVPASKRRSLRKKITRLKEAVADREMLRFHRTRNFGLMRCLYLELGRRWADSGILQDARDIFYLTIDEIDSFGHGRSVNRSLRGLVALRRAEWSHVRADRMPAQVKAMFPVGAERVTPATKHGESTLVATRQTAPAESSNDSILRGLACSQGVIEGVVRFVRDSSDVKDVAGKILLAERTDPGWTPLFALVKGVIVERGSMLSHSAVIAREMAIPAVLNISNVTSILRDGDYVRLNGNLGTIERLTPPERVQNESVSTL